MKYLYILSVFALSFAASAQTKQETNTDTARSEKPVLILRCQKSFSNDPPPLFVVDGLPVKSVELSRLDVNDIENISVLKGNEAAALYGSEGANGVVVISTKKVLKLYITDMLDGAPLAGATLYFILKDNKDTLMGVADSLGRFNTPRLKTGMQYMLDVSAVGYQHQVNIVYAGDCTREMHVTLSRNYQSGENVVIKSFDFCMWRRKCICGTRIIYDRGVIQLPESPQNATRCFPNPLPKGQIMHLEMNVAKSGIGSICLLDAAGLLVGSQQIEMVEGLNRIEYPTGNKLTSGMYVVMVYDAHQKLIAQQKIIIQ